MSNYLKFINIPESRARIVAAITSTQNRISLTDNMRAFFEGYPKKKLTAVFGSKLHEHLIENAPHLRVARVAYASEKTTQFMSRGQLSIFMYEDGPKPVPGSGMAPLRFTVQQNLDGTLDANAAFVTYEADVAQLAHLKGHLPHFARTALRFNEVLGKLREISQHAKPANSVFPSYPLSEIYHFYELGSPGVATADPAPVEVPGVTQPNPESDNAAQ